MTIQLNNLNDEASERFENIKRRLGLEFGLSEKDIQTPIQEFRNVQTYAVKEVIQDDKFAAQSCQLEDLIQISQEQIQAKGYIDGIFSFINSLNLPPNLACSIGYIISYKKTQNIAELELALEMIEKEINKC